MSNAKPPRNLTPVLCQRLSKEMLKACQDVAAEHGLVAEAKEMAAIDLRWGFDLAFRVSIPLPEGTALDPERVHFEALAEALGLSVADYGRHFSTGRETFRIVGIDPRRPNTQSRQNASRMVRGSSSRRTRWRCYCKRGCVT